MWVDVLVERICQERAAPYVVNDAWTPSGPAHVGSLRGVILHDVVAKGLRERGKPVEFLYGFDDFDPMDGVPPCVPADPYGPHLGRPLCDVPWHEGGFPSFAHRFATEFEGVFRTVGCTPRTYRTSELYRQGALDFALRLALDRAQEIVAIEREITGSRRAERHPVQVLCEACGRIGTTVVVGWDGEVVEYECRPDKVAWARGCGYRGSRSPFRGGAKLTYRTEWAAKWALFGVGVEGAGKDHMTRGGSHDTASVVAQRIFQVEVPFPIPYEFFLVGGKKMASSRGGVSARELLEVLRPELVRFLVVRAYYKSAIDFDPAGETIPRLYDEYDRAAAAYFGELPARTPGEEQDVRDLARTFHYAWLKDQPPQPFVRPRFSKVAFWLQMPHVRVEDLVEREKGEPLTEADREELAARTEDARRWLARWAPPHYRIAVQPELPAQAAGLTPQQRQLLARLARWAENGPWSAEALQAALHALKAELGLEAKEAFGAVYLAFLGKDSGPQAGALLAALDRSFVVLRLREASGPKVGSPAP